MDEIDIRRAAAAMIHKHGPNAWFEAAVRADQILDEGDIRGSEVWKRIIKAINALEAAEPTSLAVH